MAPLATIHSYPGSWRVQRAQILAGINGQEFDVPGDFKITVSNQTPEFLKKFPGGKVPALETPSGFRLTEGGAITLFAAESGPKAGELLGTTVEERARIAQWIFFTETELGGNTSLLIGMVLGMVEYSEALYNTIIGIIERNMVAAQKAVEGGKKFLVGDRLTAADVSVACCLANLVTQFVDAESRAKVPELMAYMERILKLPEVAKFVPKVNKVETRKKPGDSL